MTAGALGGEALLNAVIEEREQLRAEVERLTAAAKAAFDALEDGDEAGAHLILQALLRNTALEDGK